MYIGKARREKFAVDSGPVITCPNCKKILMEGIVERIFTRCKFCRYWVFICKENVDTCRRDVLMD